MISQKFGSSFLQNTIFFNQTRRKQSFKFILYPNGATKDSVNHSYDEIKYPNITKEIS